MAALTSLLLIWIWSFQEVPLKPNSEFEVKIDYSFKTRPKDTSETVRLDETHADRERRLSTSPLPYVALKIDCKKLADSARRYAVTDNKQSQNVKRKLRAETPIEVVLGFTDDLKDGIVANEITVTFLTDDKTPIEKIEIRVDSDGYFFVNGEKRGKF